MNDLFTRLNRRLEVLQREIDAKNAPALPTAGLTIPDRCANWQRCDCCIVIDDDLEPFDPEKCGCSAPPYMPPCTYCESGEYLPT